MVKDKLAWICNVEDGYFRLIIDTWVRAISTDTDSLLLLYSAILRGWVFHAVAIRYFIMPMLVLINSVLSFVVYVSLVIATNFQYHMPTMLSPKTRKLLHEFGIFLQNVTNCVFDPGDYPPPTLPRLRPRQDYMEGWTYWKGRQFRQFDYFYIAAKDRLRALSVAVPLVCVVARTLCILTSFDYYARRVLFMSGDAAQTSFGDEAHDVLGHTIDKVAHMLLVRVTGYIPLVVKFVPFSCIICGIMLYSIFKFPAYKNWLDMKTWYAQQASKAPVTNFTGKVRWFPKTFEPEL
jgi:hypothetical protein